MADYDCSYCFIGLHDRCTGKSPSGDGPCDCYACSSKTLTALALRLSAEQTCEASGKTLEEINTAISNVQDITRRLTGKD